MLISIKQQIHHYRTRQSSKGCDNSAHTHLSCTRFPVIRSLGPPRQRQVARFEGNELLLGMLQSGTLNGKSDDGSVDEEVAYFRTYAHTHIIPYLCRKIWVSLDIEMKGSSRFESQIWEQDPHLGNFDGNSWNMVYETLFHIAVSHKKIETCLQKILQG